MKLPICGRAIFSGEETPIFELYVLKYPMDDIFQVSTARSAFARRARIALFNAVAIDPAAGRPFPML